MLLSPQFEREKSIWERKTERNQREPYVRNRILRRWPIRDEVSSMFDEATCQDILKKYPATLSKEQIYKLCHISKRVAKYYLDNGIIPCVNTGHATHKYMVRTTDVVDFLRKREAFPDIYKISLPSGARYTPSVLPPVSYTPQVMRRYRQLLLDLARPYPDLMTVQMIAELTGYSTKTVHTWTAAGHLRWFRNGMRYYAPKELVIEHLMSEDFRAITGKSKKHRWIISQLNEQISKEGDDNE